MSPAADQIQQMVQRALRDFESLSASEQQPSQVMGQMLQSLAATTAALGAVAWMPNPRDQEPMAVSRVGDGAKRAFSEDGMPEPAVLEVVLQATRENKPTIVSPEQPGFAATQLHDAVQFFVPMDAAGRVMGVIQIIQTPDLDPKVFRQYIAFTQQAARAAAVYLARRQSQVLAEESASHSAMLKLIHRLLEIDKPAELINELANHSRPMLESQRVAVVGFWKRKPVVEFSDAVETNKKAVLVRSMQMIADTARQRQVPMTFVHHEPLDDDDDSLGPLLEDVFGFGNAAVLCLTLVRHEEKVLAVIAVEYPDTDTADRHMQTQQLLSQHMGPVLRRTVEAHKRPLRRTSWLLGKVCDQPVSAAAKVGAGVIAVAMLIYFLFFVPMTMSVHVDARLEPARLGSITSPQDGRIDHVFVTTGQQVHAGDVMMTLDPIDLKMKMAELIKAIEQERVKLQDARTKGDAAAARTSELNIEQMNVHKQTLQLEIDRTKIRSPIDGVVLTEHTQQMENMNVGPGDPLLHVADLGRFELVMEVQEEDLALIENSLKDHRPVPVEFLSRPWPDRVQVAQVTSLSELSPTSGPDERGQEHVFRITVPIDLKNMSPHLVLANPTGRAKLQVEPASLAYNYGRRVWRFVQMTLLF